MWSPSFCFDDTRPTEIYPLSLHDALPILRLARAGAPWRTVIGVAGDVRERFDVREAWYLPYAQNASSPPAEVLELMVRSHGDPGPLATAVRAVVAALDPSLALADVATMQDVRAATLSQQRVAAPPASV